MQQDLLCYCLHVKSGQEQNISKKLVEICSGFATPVIQEQHISRSGKKSLVDKIMLPGYLFLYTKDSVPFSNILRIENVYNFLSYDSNDSFCLEGQDEAFAMWIYRHGGKLKASNAVQIGSEVRIISGPLKDHVGTVKKIDRHSRNICLNIQFDTAIRTVWLPFIWTGASQKFRLE